MIKAITFDLDGVYFPNGKANFIKNLVTLGVPVDEVKRVFLKSDEMNKLYKTGKMSDEQFWTWAAIEWKLNQDWSEIVNLLISGYDINDKVVEVVRTVRQNGYKTLICSSNFPARINGLHKKYKFLDNFDAWALSYEVGVNKPDPLLFKELINKASVPPETIVYADDYQPAVDTANSVGITTFLYESFDQFLVQLKDLGIKI